MTDTEHTFPETGAHYWRARFFHAAMEGLTREALHHADRFSLLGQAIVDYNFLPYMDFDRKVWNASVDAAAIEDAVLPLMIMICDRLGLPIPKHGDIAQVMDRQMPRAVRKEGWEAFISELEGALGTTLAQSNTILLGVKQAAAECFPEHSAAILALRSNSEMDETLSGLRVGRIPHAWMVKEPAEGVQQADSTPMDLQNYWMARLVVDCHDGLKAHMFLNDDGGLQPLARAIAANGMYLFINDGMFWSYGDQMNNVVMHQLFGLADAEFEPMLNPHPLAVKARDRHEYCDLWLPMGLSQAHNIINAHKAELVFHNPSFAGWAEELIGSALDNMIMKQHDTTPEISAHMKEDRTSEPGRQRSGDVVDPEAQRDYWWARFFEEVRIGLGATSFFTPGGELTAFGMAFKDKLLPMELIHQPGVWHLQEKAPHTVIRKLHDAMGLGAVLDMRALEQAARETITEPLQRMTQRKPSDNDVSKMLKHIMTHAESKIFIRMHIEHMVSATPGDALDRDYKRNDYLTMTRPELDEHVRSYFRQPKKNMSVATAVEPLVSEGSSVSQSEGLQEASIEHARRALAERVAHGLRFEDFLLAAHKGELSGYEPTPFATMLNTAGVINDAFTPEHWKGREAEAINAIEWLGCYLSESKMSQAYGPYSEALREALNTPGDHGEGREFARCDWRKQVTQDAAARSNDSSYPPR